LAHFHLHVNGYAYSSNALYNSIHADANGLGCVVVSFYSLLCEVIMKISNFKFGITEACYQKTVNVTLAHPFIVYSEMQNKTITVLL
jgi:hypothetical protein